MSNIKSSLADIAAQVLSDLRRKMPLVHCLTNEVVKQITANVLLSLGAVPAMVEDEEEAAQFAGIADALLINLGTLKTQQTAAMRMAVSSAKGAKKPWVLDPVAVGAGLGTRTKFAKELLRESPTLIRGNASEILNMAGLNGGGRGPDSTSGAEEALQAAGQLARDAGSCVLVTGEVDYATDGKRVAKCRNGHVLMTKVTGVGCAMGAVAGACVAVAGNPFEGAIASAAIMGIAGELAAEQALLPGSFHVAFVDAFARLTPEVIRQRAKLSFE